MIYGHSSYFNRQCNLYYRFIIYLYSFYFILVLYIIFRLVKNNEFGDIRYHYIKNFNMSILISFYFMKLFYNFYIYLLSFFKSRHYFLYYVNHVHFFYKCFILNSHTQDKNFNNLNSLFLNYFISNKL